MTRLQQLQKDGLAPDLPPVGAAGHLIDYLFDAGPVSHTGMGEVPLAHVDLQAWQHNSGVVLQPWEARTLRRLSGDYLVSSRLALEHDAPPPYLPRGISEDRRAAVARQLKDALGGMATVSSRRVRRSS